MSSSRPEAPPSSSMFPPRQRQDRPVRERSTPKTAGRVAMLRRLSYGIEAGKSGAASLRQPPAHAGLSWVASSCAGSVGGAEDGADARRGDVLVDADSPDCAAVGQRAFEVCCGTGIGAFAERVLGIVDHFDVQPEGFAQSGEYRRDETFAATTDVLALAADADRASEQSGAVAGTAFLIVDQFERRPFGLEEVRVPERVPNVIGIELAAQFVRHLLHVAGEVYLQPLRQLQALALF